MGSILTTILIPSLPEAGFRVLGVGSLSFRTKDLGLGYTSCTVKGFGALGFRDIGG